MLYAMITQKQLKSITHIYGITEVRSKYQHLGWAVDSLLQECDILTVYLHSQMAKEGTNLPLLSCKGNNLIHEALISIITSIIMNYLWEYVPLLNTIILVIRYWYIHSGEVVDKNIQIISQYIFYVEFILININNKYIFILLFPFHSQNINSTSKTTRSFQCLAQNNFQQIFEHQ